MGRGRGQGAGVLLGTPETSRRGLSTRNALKAFISKPPPVSPTGASTPLMWLMVSRTMVKSLYTVHQQVNQSKNPVNQSIHDGKCEGTAAWNIRSIEWCTSTTANDQYNPSTMMERGEVFRDCFRQPSHALRNQVTSLPAGELTPWILWQSPVYSSSCADKRQHGTAGRRRRSSENTPGWRWPGKCTPGSPEHTQ